MSGNYPGQAGAFLIETLLGLYMMVIMLRFLLQLVQADSRNPFSQFVIKITNPVLAPLRRIIPNSSTLDLSALTFLFLLGGIKLWLLYSVANASISLPGLALLSVAEILSLSLNVFFFAILIQVILSWVSQGANYHPMMVVVCALTEPLLRPIRHRMPSLTGFDLSPIVAIIILQLTQILVVAPLRDMGRSLM